MKKIETVIDEYINSTSESAIMIDGEWGSGKTYFVKNVLIEKYSNILYIPLYGITDIAGIDEVICNEVIKKKVDCKLFKFCKKNKFTKIVLWPFKKIANLFNLLKKFIYYISNKLLKLKLGVDLSEIKKKDFVGIINQTTKLKDYILIFDDLERCSINIEDVLGYINNLVEHKNVKSIIVTNEKEINNKLDNNYELKILTCLNDTINFPNKNENNYSFNTAKTTNKINSKDIMDRIDYLYSENVKYKKIKEKLVSNTVTFEPDINKAIDEFLKEYKHSLRTNINKNVIIEVMDINKCKNLRTLKVALNYYKNIIDKIDTYVTEKFKSNRDFIFEKVLINVLFVTIAQKIGVYIPNILKGNLGTTVSLDAELKSNNDFFMAFSFVNDYISSGYFDEELMKRSLEHYNKVNYETYNENDPYTIINYYWEKESDELKNALEELKQNIIDNKYNIQLYPKILLKLSCLLSIGFEKDLIEDIINIMKEIIKYSDINYIDFHAFIDDQKVLDIYNLKVQEFNLIIKENRIEKYKTKIELLLEQENWAEKLNDYVYENNKNGLFINERGFLAKLDIDMIVSNLKKSDNKNIFCFKYAIERVYNFSNLKEYFSDDLDNLNKLIDELNKFKDSDDIMKSFALNHLYNTLVKKQELICK